MQRSPSTRGQALAAFVIGLVIVAVVGVVAIRGGASDDGPSPTPVASPTARPSDAPTVPPTDTPTDAPSGDLEVDLDIATDHDVTVVVRDASGSVTDVSSGRAGDGMSVRWGDVEVVNVDATTIRVTWVGLPVDEVIDLTISRDGAAVTLDFVQDAPPANSDAVGFDRVLVIAFDTAVDPADVEVTFPEFVPA
jgi:hypothetical protein